MKIRITFRLSVGETPHYSWDLLASNGVVIAKSDRSFKRYDHAFRSATGLQDEIFPRPDIINSKAVVQVLQKKAQAKAVKTVVKAAINLDV